MIGKIPGLHERILELERRIHGGDKSPENYTALGRAYAQEGRQDDAFRSYMDAFREEVPSLKWRIASEIFEAGLVDYETVQRGTYSQALRNLRAGDTTLQPSVAVDGQRIARSLTVREILKARLEVYHRGAEDKLLLLKTYFDSCSATAYSAEDPEHFKVVQMSQRLIALPEDFNQPFLPLAEGEYDSINAESLSRSDAKYNQTLSEGEVNEHPTWRAVVPPGLLRDYAKAVFTELKKARKEKGMGLYIRPREQITEAQLRPVYVDFLDYGSNAGGNYGLNDVNVQFVRVAQRK